MPVSAEQWRSATGTNNMRRPRQVSGSGKFSFRKSGPDGVFFAHILPVGKVPPTGKSDRLDFSAIINFMIFALAIYEILWSSEFPVEQGGIDNYLRCQMSIVACEMIAQLVSPFILKLILMLSGDVETNPGPEVVLTVNEHLRHVRAAVLNVAYKWKDFGLALGVNPDTLETIHGKDQDCLYDMLKIWIQSGQATIDHVLSALEDPSVNRCDIAKEIRTFKGDDRYEVGLGPDENDSIPCCGSSNLPLAEEKGSTVKSIRDLSYEYILENYAGLSLQIVDYLSEQKINLQSLQLYLRLRKINQVWPLSLQSVYDIFAYLDQQQLLTYWTTPRWGSLVKQYCHDNPSIVSNFEDYEKKLNVYKATQNLATWMEKHNTEPLQSKSVKDDPEIFSKITATIDVKIEGKTVQYIDELWESMALVANIPPLYVLLGRVVSGSLCIDWFVPAEYFDELVANAKTVSAENIFRLHQIVQLCVNDDVIYRFEEATVSDGEHVKIDVIEGAMLKENTELSIKEGHHEALNRSINFEEEFSELKEKFFLLKDVTLTSLVGKFEENKKHFLLFKCQLALLSGSKKMRHMKFFSRMDQAWILSSKSVEVVFTVLGGFWSEVNCSLLLHVITFAEPNPFLEDQLRLFRSSLKSFSTHATLSKLQQIESINTNPSLTPLTVHSENTEWTYTIKSMETLKEIFNHKSSLQPYALQYASSSVDGVSLTMALPVQFVPLLADSLDGPFLEELGIDGVAIGGVPLNEFRKQFPPNSAQPEDSTTLCHEFHSACQSGYFEILDVCLQHLQLDKDCIEMLMAAAIEEIFEGKSLSFVGILLRECGLDIDMANEDGNTALHLAAENDRPDILNLLLEAGSNREAKDGDGDTALISACFRGHLRIVQQLLKAGATVDSKRTTGATPLFIACQKGHLHIAELLINSGCIVDSRQNRGHSPLHMASYNGHLDIVQMLLKGSADPNAVDENGLTPMMFAIREQHPKVVSALLKHKADVNILDTTTGWPALFHAANAGDSSIVEMLLEYGADVDIKDKNNATASDVALLSYHQELSEIIQKQSKLKKTEQISREVKEQTKSKMERLMKLFEVLEDRQLPEKSKKREFIFNKEASQRVGKYII